MKVYKVFKSGSVIIKRVVLNLGVLGVVSWINLVIKSKSFFIKGVVLESGLIVKSVCSVVEICIIKRVCVFKIKIIVIKGGVIGGFKFFIESECFFILFCFVKSGVFFKSEIVVCIVKCCISSVSCVFKRIVRFRSRVISFYVYIS